MCTRTIRHIRTLATLVLVAVLVTACSGKPAPDATQIPNVPTAKVEKFGVGLKAPDFSVKDVATGETITLDSLRGQVVLLNFWATWCPPCKAEMPDLQIFQKATVGKVRVVAVGIYTEEVEGMKAYAKERGLTFTIGYDGGKAGDMYQAISIPTSYFIDQTGVLRSVYVGAMPLARMRDMAEKTEEQGRSNS